MPERSKIITILKITRIGDGVRFQIHSGYPELLPSETFEVVFKGTYEECCVEIDKLNSK